jgi:hypothetical protein
MDYRPAAVRWLAAETRTRRIAIAAGIYLVCTIVYFAFAARQTLVSHTPWNHFALLAQAWLEGRLDLGGPPPAYAGNNDFAEFQGKWYVTFPPFPALLLVPLVKLAGSAERVQDGQFFLWLAGIGPAVLFLAIEKLRRLGLTGRGEQASILFSLLFAFGSVYFFTAEQGTVWFAAHVVAVALAALYLLFALDAERPVLAGLVLALGFMTRTPLLFAAPLFVFEAFRVSLAPAAPEQPQPSTRRARLALLWRRLDRKRFVSLLVSFAIPIVFVLAIAFWYNRARFGHAFEFGYRYLTVQWRPRMEKWGLFHYHYLGRNLAVVLTSVPWLIKPAGAAPFQINAHGLALWLTTPLYLWLLWPRVWSSRHLALWVTVAAVAVPTLFYQNTGWLQFGYRFSNDYAVFLFALLAIGRYRFGFLFWLAAAWALAVNGFGALSFGRPKFSAYYYQEGTQRVLHQPD